MAAHFNPRDVVFQIPPQEEAKWDFEKGKMIQAVTQFDPKATGNETNGSYYLFINEALKFGVYKPSLQARGALDSLAKGCSATRAGIPAGSEAFRERLAFSLSMELSQKLSTTHVPLNNFGIPPTIMVGIFHQVFGEHHQVGSLQQFASGYDACPEEPTAPIPKNELIKAALIDCIFLNTDRHLGNLLYNKKVEK